jgi:aspartyl-tRNA(Asn)/glutamyl-tRNA(Gln) amidotransferase subunit A
MKNAPTLATLAADLECGRTSARKLVDECLAKIGDGSGEGIRTFIHVSMRKPRSRPPKRWIGCAR